MNLTLELADVSDIPELNKVKCQSLSHWPYSKSELAKAREIYNIDEEHILKNHLYWVRDDEKNIGFFSIGRSERSPQENELHCFFICKEFIGSGYGRNMWKICCKKAAELNMKSFLILSNPYAEGFYCKMGAEKIDSISSRIRIGTFTPLLKFYLTD